MGDIGIDGFSPLFTQRSSSIAKGARRIDDIVDHDADTSLHIANDVHHFRLARALATLVDDGKIRIDPLCHGARAHHTAHIRRHDHKRLVTELLLDVAHKYRCREQIISRNIEKALDLARMQIERQHPIGPCRGDQIGNELR